MSPRHTDGQPPQAARTANTEPEQRDRSRSATRREAIGWFDEYPPAGRRTTYLQLIRHCPRCQGAHLHRSAQSVTGGWRTGSCGRRYKLVPARQVRVPRQLNEGQLTLGVPA